MVVGLAIDNGAHGHFVMPHVMEGHSLGTGHERVPIQSLHMVVKSVSEMLQTVTLRFVTSNHVQVRYRY